MRVCDGIIKMRIVIDNSTATAILAYAPQARLIEVQNDHFYEILLQTTSVMTDNNFIIVANNFSDHVDQHITHEEAMDSERNEEDVLFLDF